MYFNRFDICEAYYCFASDWHGGQWSKEYMIFSRLHHMGFKARQSLSFETLTDNAKQIYLNLVHGSNFNAYLKDM